jgi:hypothetical protein
MPSRTTIVFALLLLGNLSWAAQNDPCATASSASEVRFELELKGRTVFQEGEIIPLVLSFTSTAKKRYCSIFAVRYSGFHIAFRGLNDKSSISASVALLD